MFLCINSLLEMPLEADNRSDLIHKLAMLNRRYGKGENGHKVSFAIMGAHGSAEDVTIGPSEAKTSTYYYIESHIGLPRTLPSRLRRPSNVHSKDARISIADLNQTITSSILETFFEDGATLILFSCQTGLDERMPKTINPQTSRYTSLRGGRRLAPLKSWPRTIPGRKFFAQTLAEHVKGKKLNIIAPSISTYTESVDVEFVNGKPRFSVIYLEEGIARTYSSNPTQS